MEQNNITSPDETVHQNQDYVEKDIILESPRSKERNIQIKRIALSGSKHDEDSSPESPEPGIHHQISGLQSKHTTEGLGSESKQVSKMNSLREESRDPQEFEIEVNVHAKQKAELAEFGTGIQLDEASTDILANNLINIQCSNVPMDFMERAEQAAHDYAVKETARKSGSKPLDQIKEGQEAAKPKIQIQVQVQKNSRKQHVNSYSASRYGINQRVRKGTDATVMSMTQQNLNKIRMSRASLNNINILHSQNAIEQFDKKGSYKLMMPYERDIEPIFQFEKIKSQLLSAGTTTQAASVGTKTPIAGIKCDRSSYQSNPHSQLASRQTQQRMKNLKYQTGTNFFKSRKSIQDNQKIDLLSHKREAKTSDRRFRDRNSHQDFFAQQGKLNSDIPIIIQAQRSSQQKEQKRHKSQQKVKVATSILKQMTSPNAREIEDLQHTSADVTPANITQTPVPDFIPMNEDGKSLSTACLQKELTEENKKDTSQQQNSFEKKTKKKGLQMQKKQLYKLQSLIVNDQFEQYDLAKKYLGESPTKPDKQVLMTDQSAIELQSPILGSSEGGLDDRAKDGTAIRENENEENEGAVSQDKLKKVYPNLHFDKPNSAAAAEIFVLKDEKVIQSLGTKSPLKEIIRKEENISPKVIAIMKNSSYVKNMKAQKQLQDARYKSYYMQSPIKKQASHFGNTNDAAIQFLTQRNSFSPSHNRNHQQAATKQQNTSIISKQKSQILTTHDLNADLKFTPMGDKDDSKVVDKFSEGQHEDMFIDNKRSKNARSTSIRSSNICRTASNPLQTQVDHNESGTLTFSDKGSVELGKKLISKPNIKSGKNVAQKPKKQSVIQSGVENISNEDCPLTTINEQTKRLKEEKNLERKQNRVEFEKRQSEHINRKENKILSSRDTKKVVRMSLMQSPVQTLGKVSMICRRQENIMSQQLVQDRDTFLASPIHITQDVSEKPSTERDLSPKQYKLEPPKYQMSQKMTDKLENKYVKKDSAKKSNYDSDGENKDIGGKIKPKYIKDKQDHAMFIRLIPNLPDQVAGLQGARAIIDETKAKLKKHKAYQSKGRSYLSGMQYHEMNQYQQETYNLMHKLRNDIKPETLQAKLQQYIKENRDEEKLNEFCKDLEQAQKAKEAKREQDALLKQRLGRQRTVNKNADGQLSPTSDDSALDMGQRLSLRRQKTRELLTKKATSTRLIVDMFLQENAQAEAMKREVEKENALLDKTTGKSQLAGTTYCLTPEQRNTILRKLQQIPILEKKHQKYMEERQQEYSRINCKDTDIGSKARQHAEQIKTMERVKAQLAKRDKDFMFDLDGPSTFDNRIRHSSQPRSSDGTISILASDSPDKNASSSSSSESEGKQQRAQEAETIRRKQEKENRNKLFRQQKKENDRQMALRRKMIKQLTFAQEMKFEDELKHESVLAKKKNYIDEMQFKRRGKFGFEYTMLQKTSEQNLNLLRNIRKSKQSKLQTSDKPDMAKTSQDFKKPRIKQPQANGSKSVRSDCRLIAKNAHLQLNKKAEKDIKHQYGWVDYKMNSMAKIDDDLLKYIGGIYENLDKLRRNVGKDDFEDIILANIVNDDKQLLIEEAELISETMKELNEKVSTQEFLRNLFQKAHKRLEENADISSDDSMNNKYLY